MYHRFGKRLLDLTLTIPALIILSPALVIIALLVRVKLGTPVIFRQQRPGWHGQPFTIMKFRTLTNTRNAQGKLLPDAERITPFGKFLRRSSLDELPELLNIVKGEMSLVGPRPLLMAYLNKYSPRQMRRQDVRPGLTGWAQVNGRNGLTWEEKFNLDVWYVEHYSLGLDIKIILMTLWKVLKRVDINQIGHVTMSEFKGTANGQNGHSQTKATIIQNNAPNSIEKHHIIEIVEQPKFSPEFKAQVVLEVLSGVKGAVETCQEYNLTPQLLAKWQADFLENAAKAFQSEPQP